MKETHNKGKLIWTIVVSAVAALLTVFSGVMLSLFTGYVSDEQHLVVKLLVWIANVFACYSLTYLCAYIAMKIRFRKELPKGKYKFFGWVALLLTYGASAVLVMLIGGSFDYSYVVTFSAMAAMVATIRSIIKLLCKNEDTDEKNASVTTVNTEEKTNIAYANVNSQTKKKSKKGRR